MDSGIAIAGAGLLLSLGSRSFMGPRGFRALNPEAKDVPEGEEIKGKEKK